jgi:hypothetical protein
MDSSAAIAAAYLQLNGFFVLTELPVDALSAVRQLTKESEHAS